MPLNRRSRTAYLGLKLRVIGCLLAGRSGRAEVLLGRMLRRWPDDAYALASRAHLNGQAGLLDLAISDAQQLVAVHPERSAADWFNLAYLLERRGRPLDADPAFRRALALDPELDRAWYGLGLSLIERGCIEEAVAALKRNIELQPMSPFGWYHLAHAHVKRQETDEARRIIRHLKGFEPKVAAQLESETGLKS